jgi:hypothetical protein
MILLFIWRQEREKVLVQMNESAKRECTTSLSMFACLSAFIGVTQKSISFKHLLRVYLIFGVDKTLGILPFERFELWNSKF